MSASSSAARAPGSVVVVTHVHQTIQPVLPPRSSASGQRLNPANNYPFSRGQTLIVGLMQIIVALIILVFGSIMAKHNQNKLTVNSGIFAWGPLLFIIAGFVMLSTGTSMSHSRMKSAVCYNVIAAVAALIGSILYFLDTAEILEQNDFPPWFPDKDETRFRVFTGVSAVLCFLEFGLSMCVAGNSCRRQHNPTAQPFTITNQFTRTTPVIEETPPTPMDPPPPYEKPPDYSSIVN